MGNDRGDDLGDGLGDGLGDDAAVRRCSAPHARQ